VIFGGDWKQMLPVVRGGDNNAAFFASAKNLDYFTRKMVRIHRLTINHRLQEDEQQYLKQLKCYGTGVGRQQNLFVPIKEEMWKPDEAELIQFVFQDALSKPVVNYKEVKGAAILCPLNDDCFRINNILLVHLYIPFTYFHFI
jgi:hypothetical protein